MKKQPIPFHLTLVRGAIGKEIVIKHYKGGRKVMTRYPDMSNIKPSVKQKRQRRLFKLATKYANEIFRDPVKREERRRTMRRPWRLYQALMKEWFDKRAQKAFWAARAKRIQQEKYMKGKQGNPNAVQVNLVEMKGTSRVHTTQHNTNNKDGMPYIPSIYQPALE